MDIVIREQNEKAAEQIKALCIRYLIRENRESDIFIAERGEQFQAIIDEMEMAGIFLLSVELDQQAAARKLAEKNGIHYIVLIADSMKKILDSISPEMRPAGFLLSPVDEEKLDTVLDTLWEDYQTILQQDQKDIFCFHIGAAAYAVPVEQILYFESAKKKILLHTAGQEFEFYDSLGRVETQLPDDFIRVHKSYIVNMKKVKKADYGDMTLYLESDCHVYFSRSCKQKVKEVMRGS